MSLTSHDLYSKHETHEALKADLQVRVTISDCHQITDFIAEWNACRRGGKIIKTWKALREGNSQLWAAKCACFWVYMTHWSQSLSQSFAFSNLPYVYQVLMSPNQPLRYRQLFQTLTGSNLVTYTPVPVRAVIKHKRATFTHEWMEGSNSSCV